MDWAFRKNTQRQEALLSNAAFVPNSSQKRGHEKFPKGRHPILVVFGLAAVWRFFLQRKNSNKKRGRQRKREL